MLARLPPGSTVDLSFVVTPLGRRRRAVHDDFLGAGRECRSPFVEQHRVGYRAGDAPRPISRSRSVPARTVRTTIRAGAYTESVRTSGSPMPPACVLSSPVPGNVSLISATPSQGLRRASRTGS